MSNLQNNTTGLQAILAAVNALPEAGEPLPDLIADEPETMGQRACLARAAQLRDIKFTPVADLVCISNTYAAGTTVTGIPYSSTRLTDNFIGFNVSLHTFMTALHNPKSVLYTKHSDETLAKTWYGMNCSVYVSWCLDMLYHNATALLPFMDTMEEIAVDNMRLCDAPVASTNNGGTVGHCTLITGIERDKNGTIQYVTISHCNAIKTIDGEKRYTYAERMTYADFVADYITAQGYKIFRFRRLWDAVYEPSEYIALFDEPEREIAYSDLNTTLGDKATFNVGASVTLNPLVTAGYTAIKLYKDGAEVGSYSVGDVELSDLTAGEYVAVLEPEGDNSRTSFIVEDATVTKEGTRYYFSAALGTPIRVVFKNSAGYTLHAVDLTAEDVRNGYKDITYTDGAADHICVPCKNDYGFVVARCAYTETPETNIPTAYQEVEYIGVVGGQYIDTGVLASDHQDGITYTMRGNASGIPVTTQTCYMFGALSGGVRTGNVALGTSSGSTDAYISLLCGSSSGVMRQAGFNYNTDFELVLTASSNVSDTSMYLNGTACTRQSYVTTAAMPAANIWLFGCNGIATNRGYLGKCSSFTMADAEGNAIRNFVPCYRKSDSVVGLYDTVSGAFFTNAGTGSFTAGPEV